MTAILVALAAAPDGLTEEELGARLREAGVAAELGPLIGQGLVARGRTLRLTPEGVARLREQVAALEQALEPGEACPSVPLLTTVQTRWIDALSLNYAVDPEALGALLPRPLMPEIFHGTAWMQVLVSSLRDLRPQGLAPLFGVCFYQISYRAAVRCAGRRGGYFVRSDTNHALMRAVGNTLAEFRFHDFGLATMTMVRSGAQLTIGVEPEEAAGRASPGRLFGVFDLSPQEEPPPGSVWGSLAELHGPLVECYDAFGVDAEAGFLYTLTIDREPWDPRFVRPLSLYCEFVDPAGPGPLAGRCRLDSVLHVRDCAYRWRPLRRERLGG